MQTICKVYTPNKIPRLTIFQLHPLAAGGNRRSLYAKKPQETLTEQIHVGSVGIEYYSLPYQPNPR